MKTVILAGGMGTRLSEETEVRPKPMVEIGGRPILWHIMKIFAAFGQREFLIALGYKGEMIKSYFLNYHYLQNNITVNLGGGQVNVHGCTPDDWTVHLVDTGLQTNTGGRIRRLKEWIGNETFMMTYGDGVARLDVAGLLAFHRRHGRLATITAVRPPGRFGGLNLEDDFVTQFVEKPQLGEGWINGGFFVLEPEVLDFIDGDDTSFEGEPLERLARDEQLVAYRLDEFWQCMDTLRDVRFLNAVWEGGEVPWRIWR